MNVICAHAKSGHDYHELKKSGRNGLWAADALNSFLPRGGATLDAKPVIHLPQALGCSAKQRLGMKFCNHWSRERTSLQLGGEMVVKEKIEK